MRSPEDSAYDRRSSSAKVRSPLPILGGKHARTCDQANLKSLGRGVSDKVAGVLAPGPKHFPSAPPRFCAGGATAGSDPALVFSPIAGKPAHDGLVDEPAQADMPKKNGLDGLIGKTVHELGFRVYQLLLEVLPLRGSSMGKRNSPDFFPLPTSKSVLAELVTSLDEPGIAWLQSICVSLNALWGGGLFFEGPVSPLVVDCLTRLGKDVLRFQRMDCVLETFSWSSFFASRGIDYKGDEVKVARSFSWEHIRHALPKEVGRVPLEEVCTLGANHYVTHFDHYIKDPREWTHTKPPKVMVSDQHWPEVCRGLVDAGVCVYLAGRGGF